MNIQHRKIPRKKEKLITEVSHCISSKSFTNQYLEIIENYCLFFEATNQKSKIIDYGTKIGMSILYYNLIIPRPKLSDYKLGKLSNTMGLNILRILQMLFYFFVCLVQLVFDSLRISTLD